MVRIHRIVDSETLHLPELRPFFGKGVEIIIKEEKSLEISPGTGDWQAAQEAVRRLQESGYDFDAWRLQRDMDLHHANDHVL